MSLEKSLGRLPSGREAPLLGLGTFQLKGGVCRVAVEEAIRCGYRLIDTAQAYGNEDMVGMAVQACVGKCTYLSLMKGPSVILYAASLHH